MPQYDWSRTHQDETTSHHCFANVTGCTSSNTLITSCAWWFIAVCIHRCLHERAPSYLPDGAHHTIRSCTQPSWTQILWVEDCGSTAHTFITWRSSVRPVHGTVCRSPFVQSTLLFQKKSQDTSFNVAFNPWYFAYFFTAVVAVKRPCCVFISLTAP